MDRRKRILKILSDSPVPVTGSELARRLGVSRQVIVQDVAILRARGNEILATPQGYMLLCQPPEKSNRTVLAVTHPPARTAEELYILVDSGLKVIDVIVEHPLYGDLRGSLMLSSREDVDRFMTRLKEENAALLSALTGGFHLHTVEFTDIEKLKRAKDLLRAKGFLAERNP